MRARHAGVLVVVLALGVWTTRAVEAQAPKKPCTLLSAAQVGSVTGLKVGAGQPIGVTGCQWGTGEGVQPHGMATVSFVDPTWWAKMKTPVAQIRKEPTTGVGEDAFYTTVGPLTSLSLKAKGSVFVVRIYGIHDAAKQKAMEKALALDVLGKL